MKLIPDITILTSGLWQTNTGIIHGPIGAVLIDPGIFPDEFEAIAREARDVVAGFCTHGHWDHVLWHQAFGDQVPRFATAETIAVMQKDRERILRNLTRSETEFREAGLTDQEIIWDRDLLFQEQPMAWGAGSIAGISVELIPVPGHEDGQAALLLPEYEVCFVADTLSDVEVPAVHMGSQAIAVYLQTLDRLEDVLNRVEWIVPGHGSPANRADALQRLEADRRYLRALVPMVNAAKAEEGTDDLARRILTELDEHRADDGLAWSMHLSNVEQLIEERERRSQDLPLRQSSRIILLDEENRVWLLRIQDPVRPRWITPGGGVEEGETFLEAAARELWEECAINDAEIGPLVAVRERDTQFTLMSTPEGVVPIEPTWYHTREQYYVVRLNTQQPNIGNMYAYESDDYTLQGWFSAEEIRASVEQVYPIGLADLLDQLGRGEIPDPPIVWED